MKNLLIILVVLMMSSCAITKKQHVRTSPPTYRYSNNKRVWVQKKKSIKPFMFLKREKCVVKTKNHCL